MIQPVRREVTIISNLHLLYRNLDPDPSRSITKYQTSARGLSRLRDAIGYYPGFLPYMSLFLPHYSCRYLSAFYFDLDHLMRGEYIQPSGLPAFLFRSASGFTVDMPYSSTTELSVPVPMNLIALSDFGQMLTAACFGSINNAVASAKTTGVSPSPTSVSRRPSTNAFLPSTFVVLALNTMNDPAGAGAR